jgi:hypothetical protein
MMTYLSHKIRGVKNRLEFLEVSLQNLRCMFLTLNVKRENTGPKKRNVKKVADLYFSKAPVSQR